MDISICSYSFHRLLAEGKQDIFRYVTDCKELGCTHLDPWNGHFPLIAEGDRAVTPDTLDSGPLLSPEEIDYILSIRAAADIAGMSFRSLAVDGAHIYEPDPETRRVNRRRAYRWLEIAAHLGARQVRIDAGGPPDMPQDVFAVIKEGYRDLIGRAGAGQIEIIVENHWGPTLDPSNVLKLLESIPGLGYLFDTHNWAPGLREQGRAKCAKYATATHIKTFEWDREGNETSEDVVPTIQQLVEIGYAGVWGIESCPNDGDEYAGAAKTVALLKRVVSG